MFVKNKNKIYYYLPHRAERAANDTVPIPETKGFSKYNPIVSKAVLSTVCKTKAILKESKEKAMLDMLYVY